MNEKEYLKLLADEANDTVDMFSSHRKSERERRTCAAFLRCLGTPFNLEELKVSKDEPPDVIFCDADFEVMLVLDEDRKIHDEVKKASRRRNEAKSIDELVDSYQTSIPIEMDCLLDHIFNSLLKKVSRYDSKKDQILMHCCI